MAETKQPSDSNQKKQEGPMSHPPAESQPAQEWGQREDTARTIASGGRDPATNPGSEKKQA